MFTMFMLLLYNFMLVYCKIFANKDAIVQNEQMNSAGSGILSGRAFFKEVSQ
jgi:hypothetical protein